MTRSERIERFRRKPRRAEPLIPLKTPDWKTARPLPRLTAVDVCQALECSEERVRGKSYCADHCAVYFVRRAAA